MTIATRLALQRIPIALSMMNQNTRHYGSGRKISRIVSPKKSGPINRLIGTVDIDGAGTEHSLDECNPFMLLDAAVIPKGGLPKFGAHPHRGHSVVTLLLQGKVESWDSFHDGKTIIEGPASYWVDAGSGLFHNEMTVVDDESADPLQHVKLMQLWISVKEEDRLKSPTVQHDTNLPVEEALNSEGDVIGIIRYFVGKGGSISTPHPITVAHVTQDSGTTLQFPINGEYGGFVVHLNGCAIYGNDSNSETKETYAVHVLDDNKDEKYLQITASTADSDKSKTSYLICVGQKINEPWYKKLTSNGAVVAKTKDEAREIASKVEEYSKEGLSSGNFAPFGK